MILLLGGTSDSISLYQKMIGLEYRIIYSAASEFGDYMASTKITDRIYGQKGTEQLEKLILEEKIKIVVDATHPFAVNVSNNAIEVCHKVGIQYIRYERPIDSIDKTNFDAQLFNSYQDAGKYANAEAGRIFITTGANQIEKITNQISDKKRIVARVLSLSDSIIKLESIGLYADNIIGMKGPFTEEMNYLMFKESKAKILITKESGKSGGVLEKLRAAKRLNMKVLIVRRPVPDYPIKYDSQKEIIDYVGSFLVKNRAKKIELRGY